MYILNNKKQTIVIFFYLLRNLPTWRNHSTFLCASQYPVQTGKFLGAQNIFSVYLINKQVNIQPLGHKLISLTCSCNSVQWSFRKKFPWLLQGRQYLKLSLLVSCIRRINLGYWQVNIKMELLPTYMQYIFLLSS